jgi:hypothetical protein
MKKNKLAIGDRVEFHSGNFKGLTGIITEMRYNVPGTLYGFQCTVALCTGGTGYIEKSEHWTITENQPK